MAKETNEIINHDAVEKLMAEVSSVRKKAEAATLRADELKAENERLGKEIAALKAEVAKAGYEKGEAEAAGKKSGEEVVRVLSAMDTVRADADKLKAAMIDASATAKIAKAEVAEYKEKLMAEEAARVVAEAKAEAAARKLEAAIAECSRLRTAAEEGKTKAAIAEQAEHRERVERLAARYKERRAKA